MIKHGDLIVPGAVRLVSLDLSSLRAGVDREVELAWI